MEKKSALARSSQDAGDKFSPGSMVAELAQVNSLPGTQAKLAVDNGDGNGLSKEGAFDMRGHIVRSFQGMGIMRSIFRHQSVKGGGEVHADAGIGVFVQGKGRGSMKNKQLEKAVGREDGQLLEDRPGDQVKSPGVGREAEFVVLNHIFFCKIGHKKGPAEGDSAGSL